MTYRGWAAVVLTVQPAEGGQFALDCVKRGAFTQMRNRRTPSTRKHKTRSYLYSRSVWSDMCERPVAFWCARKTVAPSADRVCCLTGVSVTCQGSLLTGWLTGRSSDGAVRWCLVLKLSPAGLVEWMKCMRTFLKIILIVKLNAKKLFIYQPVRSERARVCGRFEGAMLLSLDSPKKGSRPGLHRTVKDNKSIQFKYTQNECQRSGPFLSTYRGIINHIHLSLMVKPIFQGPCFAVVFQLSWTSNTHSLKNSETSVHIYII